MPFANNTNASKCRQLMTESTATVNYIRQTSYKRFHATNPFHKSQSSHSCSHCGYAMATCCHASVFVSLPVSCGHFVNGAGKLFLHGVNPQGLWHHIWMSKVNVMPHRHARAAGMQANEPKWKKQKCWTKNQPLGQRQRHS